MGIEQDLSGRRSQQWRAGFAALVAFTMLPAIAWANAGTPLMWLPGLHLVFGNAIIGIGEGVIIALLFRASLGPAIFFMLLANYLTMAVGLAVLPRVHELVIAGVFPGEERLFAAPRAMAWTWGAAVVMSVLAEWPFVAMAVWLRKRATSPARAAGLGLAGSVVVHAASYACIIPQYHRLGTQRLHTDFAVERDTSFVSGRLGGWVYFVDDQAGEVRRVRLDGGAPETIGEIGREYRLAPRALEGGGWEVWAVPIARGEGGWDAWGMKGEEESVRLRIDAGAAGRVDSSVPWEVRVDPTSPGGWSIVGDLQTDKRWRASPGLWALEGLRVWREGEFELRVAYETIFDRWAARYATILPDDLIVWQVGEWIAVLDCEARRWGLLVRGRCPVVVLDE